MDYGCNECINANMYECGVMNCINFGNVIFCYNKKRQLVRIIKVKEYLELIKNERNYEMIKNLLDARAIDRKMFWW